MRVAFVGKGGSGKTSLSAVFVRLLEQQGYPVLAIDADINQHLGMSFGLNQAETERIPQMGNALREIKRYLRGTNPRIPHEDHMLKTTPPGTGSNLLYLRQPNPIWDSFAQKIGGIQLLVTGQFEHEDIGIKCYHAKTGAVELLLNHIVDGAGEYVVVDMTAGADAFASGLFTRFDLTCIVVEPTQKSIGVYHQYAAFAEEYGVKLALVANKVRDVSDIEFITQQTKQVPLAVIPYSQGIARSERDGLIPLEQIEPSVMEGLQQIHTELDRTQKNWPRFLEQAKHFHIKNALSWGNVSTGQDVTHQIDPDYIYPSV